MSPFRLFGRPLDHPERERSAADDADGGVHWAPGPWGADPAPATRHARPVALSLRPAPGGYSDDPPTDPYGFPPVPVTGPAPGGNGSHTARGPGRPAGPAPTAVPPPDPREAAALAGAFAADYLSWDEDDPGRRGRVLAGYLAPPAGDPTLLGWDGRGRQRAEFALPGEVRPDGDDRVLVDVRVRVTPYRAVGDRTEDGAAEAADADGPRPEVPGVPAVAPAPTGHGWLGCPSHWIRLSVPVAREDGRLVVDAADEVADEPPAAHRPEPDPAPGRLRDVAAPAPLEVAAQPLARAHPAPEEAW